MVSLLIREIHHQIQLTSHYSTVFVLPNSCQPFFDAGFFATLDQPDRSSDGGALLLKGIDSQLDLTARLAACIEDNRQQSNAPSKKDFYKLAIELADIVVSHHAERLGGRADHSTIDLDPTDDPTHGKQQLSFFNGYYDTWCYLPVVGTIRGRGDAENRIKELHTQSSIGGHLR